MLRVQEDAKETGRPVLGFTRTGQKNEVESSLGVVLGGLLKGWWRMAYVKRTALRMRGPLALLLVGTLLSISPGVWAASYFFAGELKDGQFTADPAVKGPCFRTRFSTHTFDIDGARARTHISESIEGFADTAQQVVCLIPLPESAEKAGVTAEPAIPGLAWETLSAAQAQPIYEAIARGSAQPGLLTCSGKPALLIRSIPVAWLSAKAELSIEYESTVRETGGLFEFAALLPNGSCARDAVGRVAVTATIRNTRPLRGLICPSHETTVDRTGLHEACVRVTADQYRGTGAFTLFWAADEDPLGLRVLAHRVPGEDEGYFMLLGNPTGSAKAEPAVPKDVTFVLDISGSMRGEKMEQARSAIEYCLERLHPGDRFNLITFGTEVRAFRDDVVAWTPENLEAARTFAEEAVATGRTNISEALAKGFAGKAEPGRPRLMLFLTDGTPTAGELRPEEILKNLAELNKTHTRVFVFGVGHDVNVHLLDKLAVETDGQAEYVSPEEEIDVKVAALYNRLSYPVLTNVQISYDELSVFSVYPKKVPALFRGSQILLAGRYREGGTHTVSVNGTLNGQPMAYTCKAEFPKDSAPEHAFVATLWAARTIGFLLQEIRLKGENKELIEEVVRLSRKYGIVTEYTAFLATGTPVAASDEEVAAEATSRMRQANEQKAGQWAFNQALNDKGLQEREVASVDANTYVDRSGQVKKAENIRQIGRRVFRNVDGVWQESEEAGKRKVRAVKLFSPEYLDLVRTNADFAKAQEMGQRVDMNVGDERVHVEE